ncbi:hypothetical protein FMEAI12_4660008 [Parafrankia sp. Ea1.12]|nr:hypothetical protein FMEAI12_4660008 [Parafrankia sp. Ea1.12]
MDIRPVGALRVTASGYRAALLTSTAENSGRQISIMPLTRQNRNRNESDRQAPTSP